MKFKIAYVTFDQTFIVFTGSQIIEKDLSEDAATRLAQFLNTQEYLSTSPKARAVRARPLPSFDFERIYQMYPRKIGRKSGIEKLRKQVTTIEKYQLLEQAVLNYAKMNEQTEECYILHFSTFTGRWADFLPEDTVVDSQKSQLSIDDITSLMSN